MLITKHTLLATLAAITLLAASSGMAETRKFQNGKQGYKGCEDNTLMFGNSKNKNVGGAYYFQAGFDVYERRGIMRFDVSTLEEKYSEITSARIELVLRMTIPDTKAAFGVSMYQIADANADWIEGDGNITFGGEGSSWGFKVGPYEEKTVWVGSEGLSASGTDYIATPLGSVTVSPGDKAGTIYSFDVDSDLVDQWVNGDNAGVIFTRDNTDTNGKADFCASENDTVPYRPRLIVEYEAE